MANSKNNNPVLFDLYDQETHIAESRTVYDGCIDMGGLPDSYIGVTVTDENNDRLREITDGKAPKQGEFRVDYKHGWLYVDPKTYNKQTLTLDFYSRGLVLTPASRIYTIDANGCVDLNKTLQTYIDEVNGHCKFEISDKFENLQSGDSFNIMFGKLSKWYEVYNNKIKNLEDTKADKVTNKGFVAGGARQIGDYGVVIGDRAEGGTSSVGIGDGAKASSDETVAIGMGAKAAERHAIQLGAGTNSNEKTLQVYDYQVTKYDNINDIIYLKDVGNLEDLETVNKTDIICSINSIINNDTLIKNGNGGFSGGEDATSITGGSVGLNAKTYEGGAAGEYAHSFQGGAVGYEAFTTNGGSMGFNTSSHFGGAIGEEAKAGDGFSGGYYACVGDNNGHYIDAIQLGTGTNNNEKTLQVYDKRIVEADGSLTDVGDLGDLPTKDKTNIVNSIIEMNSKPTSSIVAIMDSPISISTDFSIDSSGNWAGDLTISQIKIKSDLFPEITIPQATVEFTGQTKNFGETKHMFVKYTFDGDNITIGELLKPDERMQSYLNSYIEVEDGTKIKSITIYLGNFIITSFTSLEGTILNYYINTTINPKINNPLLCVTSTARLEEKIAQLEEKLKSAISTDALIQGNNTIVFDNGDSIN